VAVTAIVVAFVIVAGAVWFWASYDPLCHEPCGGVSGVHGPGVARLGSITSPQGESFNAYRLELRQGQEFSFWVTLSNKGPFDVTVARIGVAQAEFQNLPVVRVQMESPANALGASPAALVPFRPFSLGSHEQSPSIYVTMQLAQCFDEGTSTTIGSIPVSYRFLGLTHHTTVFLYSSIEVTGTPGTSCG
jgi:hypothetical protein